ncbi:D-TA family PLP-dependent enzyme [Sphingobacterium wenxiniae]|uniref:D-serine deaminase, pyridoxal phosphate-dependent n=1 Tax=Sphingobacterium wenxiniae TaxID=683125 RepID=A0A1I6VM49_9SPHI|nr:D-TA family PLP-dependent enzyme [Sphingobacterium wenxiniae]SFT14691.1 D-serine deaminase, pyridoxal phosphate-dependent [Sphingobacterium wenxiniae]
MENWYEVENVDQIDSPALLVYPERIKYNIRLLKALVGNNTDRLRPHVKTNKMIEVCQLMIAEGITQFKCSTIAEAEMLAMANAKEVLLAYQPVGPKLQRWVQLLKAYPLIQFSCLVDHVDSIKSLGDIGQDENLNLSVYVDLNVGMGRTGADSHELPKLLEQLQIQKYLTLQGIHGYDGHIHASDLTVRREQSDASYALLKKGFDFLQANVALPLQMVIGGSPSFTAHATRSDVICSPGTFVFWDWGYSDLLPEQEFVYAAVLLTRVISVIDEQHICIDLGYKAVASESPLPRVTFLNVEEAKSLFQSEEHLVLEVPDSSQYPIGTVLYAVPRHICPTVALYDRVSVIEEQVSVDTWNVIARNRMLNF